MPMTPQDTAECSRDRSDAEPVGGSDVRMDSIGKVTGRTRYAEDMVMPGMLHACVLRSPHHHAQLKALDCTAARQMPGVAGILTATDVPGLNGLDGYSRDEPLLTPIGSTLRQRGAPIALVAAQSLREARAAAAAIAVEYDKLPHTFDPQEALKPDRPPLYPRGNVLNTYTVKHGDLDAAFAASDLIVDTHYQTTFQEHSTLEREVTLGYIDEAGRVTVVGGTHEPHWQQGYIAQTLGVDPAQVRVILPPTGGSFGSRQDPWPLVAAGLMTFVLHRPVRLAYSRREVFDATPKRHPYDMHFRVGARRDGRFTGIRVRTTCNTGGYDSAGYWIPNYAITASGGAYIWQAVDAWAQSVYTNGPKAGQFRGFGTPQSTFALECTLDEMAQRLGVDPLELRLTNRLQEGVNSFLGYPVAETLGYAEVLDALRPRYTQLLIEAEAFNAAAQDGAPRMGVGIAGMWYRFGKSGTLRIETHAELASDGHLVFYCSAPDYGQGINTVMLQLVAETLHMPRERLELINADTALTPDSGIQGASRATYFIGSSICNAAENLQQEILSVAAEMLDADPLSLTLQADAVRAARKLTRSVTLTEIAREFDRLGKSRKVLGVFDLTPLFPDETRPEYIPLIITGAQVAQVVVDQETGQVEVKKVVAAHDVGHAINPPNAVGQIQGAVVMGIGSALYEAYVPGVSTGFTDYILPMISAVPDIEAILVEVPSRHGPLGAKGLGEAAILPTAPAVINAVSRAIGVRIREIPATPPRVRKAILSHKA